MSNIEPTEEQKQAASTHIDKWQWWDSFNQSDALARLLAEREAKLREEYRGMVDKIGQHRELIAQEEELERRGEKILELRARVAELEKLLGRWCAAEVMCNVPERRKLLDETGPMLLTKKAGV